MENATEALLIAGGILLAIITLSLLMNMFNNVNIFEETREQEKEAERLAAWNAEWEAYDKDLLYGAEVLTVINKAEQNNAENELYEIKIKVDGRDKIGNLIGIDDVENLKKSIFECIEIKYSDETGRVCEMKFNLKEDLN